MRTAFKPFGTKVLLTFQKENWSPMRMSLIGVNCSWGTCKVLPEKGRAKSRNLNLGVVLKSPPTMLYHSCFKRLTRLRSSWRPRAAMKSPRMLFPPIRPASVGKACVNKQWKPFEFLFSYWIAKKCLCYQAWIIWMVLFYACYCEIMCIKRISLRLLPAFVIWQ